MDMGARKNSTDATLAAWKFADLFNRHFRDRDKGLDQLSPSLRKQARSVLEATDKLRENNGWIRDPDALFDLADKARGELEKAKFGAPALATDAAAPKKSAAKSDDSFIILVLGVVLGALLVNGYCTTQSRTHAPARPKVHYIDPTR
jgi:hypothetical protein